MTRSRLLVAMICGFLAQPVSAANPVDLDGATETHVMIPMRDGVKISAYIFKPPGTGPWPVLLQQRYAAGNTPDTQKSFARMAKTYGYVMVMANFRGSQLSEGEWRGYRSLAWGERKDGYDLVEWLGTQPWSTGKVGTFGSSQAGYAQNFLAVTQPPHLTAQYMIDTGLSLFHEGYRIGGTTRPDRFKSLEISARVPEHNHQLMTEWFAHPTYDSYWADEDCTRFFDKMNVPCFTVGSWYDFMCVGSVDSFIGRQHRGGANSRGTQQLLIGPWLHGSFKETNVSGALTYPENAKFAMDTHMFRWFDHYLKGIDNGVNNEPTVRYYVMGAVSEPEAPGNEWRTAADWPIPATATDYFPHADGTLQTRAPTSQDASVAWHADPHHPAPIPGTAFPGAKDAREYEQHPEVRTFTSDVLTQPVEWTGKVQAELWVSSEAKDTDFIVRVSDVYPDGRSILIMDYIRRARYREGYDREVFLKKNEVTKVAFDVGWLSQIFNKGHRIRVTVASTGAPFYEPNPNTGEPLTFEIPANAVVAKNTMYVNQRNKSRIIAPVRTTP